jgi:hypothetical protein
MASQQPPSFTLLACFQTEVEYACFVIDGKDQHVQQSDDGMAMERSTVRRNSDRWITHTRGEGLTFR